VETILALLEKPQRLFSPKDYHQLRVEIKKIKALFELTGFCMHEFDNKKQFKPFRDLFKNAGRVRDLQMEIQTIAHYRISSQYNGYMAGLGQKRDEAATGFFSLMGDQLVKDIRAADKTTPRYFDYIDKKKLQAYLLYMKNEIIRGMKKRGATDEETHEMRKRIKSFFYTKKIIASKDIPVWMAEEMQELLGTWHDHLIITDHLQKEIETNSSNTRQKKFMQALISIIGGKKDALYKKLNEIKPDFIQSFRLQS
jgi:CHAD domain-containing protein